MNQGVFNCITAALFCAGSTAADFYLKDGDRVVFYGDSITDQRLYTTFTESYVVTRFPEKNVTFVHSGWGGDRVTGGGGGPIDTRLKRDVLAYKPTVMTVMLGMNDASYRPFDVPIYQTYTNGYQHIVDVMKKEVPNIRLTLIQPSPFDDVLQEPRFEGGYNQVLVKYGEFVKALAAKENLDLADLNTDVVEALKKAREIDQPNAAKLIADRVHPGPAGQLLMAAELLQAWDAPAIVTSVKIDAVQKKARETERTKVNDLKVEESGLRWEQRDEALPMPIDTNDAVIALAVKASDISETLNQQLLQVTGLATGRYALSIDGTEVKTYSSEELAKGVNLAFENTPMKKQAMDVHRLTLRHNDLHFVRWRNVQVPFSPELDHYDDALKALDKLEEDIIKQQREAAAPVKRNYELRKV